MKIFLPFALKDIGGPSTFARKFKEGVASLGHEVTFEPTHDYDILLLIVQCPLKYLVDAKRRKKKIVQRLDGTYYWSVSGWKFPLLNAKAAYIRHLFTDFTVYQSKHSQDCANRFLGKKRNDKHAIIYNGVDTNVFSPSGKKAELRDVSDQTIFFSASAFRREDQILPILEGLKQYRAKYDANFKCVIAGTFVGSVSDMPEKLKNIDYIQLLGKVNNQDLPEYERAADVFLFTHLNPPCPNNIIESLACGLPVCGINDGAMPELVTSGKTGELLPVLGSGFWRKRPFDVAQFADNLRRIVTHQKEYARESSASVTKQFTLQAMTREYVQVFESLVK